MTVYNRLQCSYISNVEVMFSYNPEKDFGAQKHKQWIMVIASMLIVSYTACCRSCILTNDKDRPDWIFYKSQVG